MLLPEKYPKARFEIIRRALDVLENSLISEIEDDEEIIDIQVFPFCDIRNQRTRFDCRLHTNKNRVISNGIDFEYRYLPYPDLAELIADTFKPQKKPKQEYKYLEY